MFEQMVGNSTATAGDDALVNAIGNATSFLPGSDSSSWSLFPSAFATDFGQSVGGK